MTNHWADIANSDCVLIMGSNPAENHPISFKWVLRAQDRGATLIHVDPRFTRTSSKCDIYACLRSGTDIAFLGGMIRYILEKDLYFKDYVVNYTNAAFVVNDKYSFQDGLFSGFDAKTGIYDKSTWAFVMDENGVPKRDETLLDPRCVLNLLKKHYERYTLDMVSETCGTPKDEIERIYSIFGATGKPDKAGTNMYAIGWTQHTTGVQNIRAMAMIQLLLGNVGVAGGGVNALRGESNVQGATDHGLLGTSWPGYLDVPGSKFAAYEDYIKAATPVSKDPKSVNWWGNKPKYAASLIKSFYPNEDVATGYAMLPKVDSHLPGLEYYWLNIFDRMHQGKFQGFFAWGQNPACSGANAGKNREAFTKLDWMVNVSVFETETGSFWKGPGMDPKKIKTEVFFLPCAMSIEKEGSVTNSGRWLQWRVQGPKPLNNVMGDGDIMLELAKEIRALYKADAKAVYPDPVLKLNIEDWEENGEYSPNRVARLINGYFLKDTKVGDKDYKKGDQVPAFAALTADGSTTSGCWIMTGSYPAPDKNLMARHDISQTPEQDNIHLFPNWSWAWPANRRILYNRAGVDKEGKPWNPAKAVIQWKDGKWVGDVVDGGGDPGAKHPFIMQTHGYGAIFGPGRLDGPFPEHYEPMEGPITKNPFSGQRACPTLKPFAGETFAVADPKYPYVGITYRLTEHWQTGVMSRNNPWLIEAEPQIFCEMSPDFAEHIKVKNGEWVTLSSVRGKVDAVAMVTERMQPLTIQGKKVHTVGVPWHYGWLTPADGGDSANLLSPSIGETNTGMPETKTFMVNVVKKSKA